MDEIKNTLLIVDDENNNLKSLKRSLEDENYTVITANSGKEALELLSQHVVQVIISDQRMPNMSGTELLKEIRKLYPKTIRMILSAHSDFDVIKEAINDGAIFKFINKPWDQEEISQYIRDAFQIYSQQEEQEKKLNTLIYQDRLTGLNNGFRFQKEISAAIDRAKKDNYQLILVLIEIDRFAKICDELGRTPVDKILQQVGVRLTTQIENPNNRARLGSDQFGILIENPSDNIDSLLDNIHNSLQLPISIDGKKIHYTVSIGASSYPDHFTDDDSLMRLASIALHTSISMGGDKFTIFDKSMDNKERVGMLSELHDALTKNEFVVFYQPIVAVTTGRITGVEALLRWQHPKLGLLSPVKFIDLCEESGLIVPIGEYVLLTACLQLKKWHDEGFSELSMAINFSARQFSNTDLFKSISDVINTTKISPEHIDIEITESLLMKNVQENIKLMQSLRTLGVKFALDDFGTGYSSLSYLRLFPFNFLKIDQSFVRDVTTKKENIPIITAIISLANTLGLRTIAEGVETDEQFELLKMLNCDLIQGYLFSKPVPADEFTKVLFENKKKLT